MIKRVLIGGVIGISISCVAVSVDHYLLGDKCQSFLTSLFSRRVASKDRRGLKVVDSNLRGHGDFEYKLGLNTCPHPFSWENNSGRGGLYYSRPENISKFIYYVDNPVLLVVSVPDTDTEVVSIGSGSDIKFRSKNLIVEKIFPLRTTSHEELVANGITSITEHELKLIREEEPVDEFFYR
jgi:hypothetical protein